MCLCPGFPWSSPFPDPLPIHALLDAVSSKLRFLRVAKDRVMSSIWHCLFPNTIVLIPLIPALVRSSWRSPPSLSELLWVYAFLCCAFILLASPDTRAILLYSVNQILWHQINTNFGSYLHIYLLKCFKTTCGN